MLSVLAKSIFLGKIWYNIKRARRNLQKYFAVIKKWLRISIHLLYPVEKTQGIDICEDGFLDEKLKETEEYKVYEVIL
jgi:uncharacterized protein YaaR (DUF327 family)